MDNAKIVGFDKAVASAGADQKKADQRKASAKRATRNIRTVRDSKPLTDNPFAGLRKAMKGGA